MSAGRSDGRKIELVVDGAQKGKRLDVIITEELRDRSSPPSRSQVAQWIEDSQVSIDGKVVDRASFKPSAGAVISLLVPEPSATHLEPEAGIPLAIVYEDDAIIVLDKPAGLLVHPGAGQRSGTLVNALVHHLGPKISRIGNALRPGVVHRLDKLTSGLLVVAKNEAAYRSLVRQLKPPRTMKRSYLAVTYALPKKGAGSTLERSGEAGTIDLPIGRHPVQRTKMAVVKSGGKQARTHWKVKAAFKTGYLLEVELETGRTHQIRVHLAHCGASIAGDPVYGVLPVKLPPTVRAAVKKFGRQALHASSLALIHPMSGEQLEFQSRTPADLRALLAAMRK